jgi:hypothetical protein
MLVRHNFTAWNRTERNIYKLDPDRDSIEAVKAPVKNVYSFPDLFLRLPDLALG